VDLANRLPAPRTAVTAACGLGATVVVVAFIALVADGPRPSRLVDGALRGWARSWLGPAGVRLEVVGRENIQPGVAYVVVSNHQSNLDPMVHLAALRIPMRFLAMRELFGLPVVGAALRRLGMIEVDRSDPDGRAIAEGTARALSNGTSVLVYPEGGTAGDGVVGRFRSGAFRLAIAHAAPVLPVATSGTRDVWPTDRNAIRSAAVRVVVGEAIRTQDLTANDAADLRERARAWIAANVGDLAGCEEHVAGLGSALQ
jgi:1-acyl-sn-glycerol-3-phosphate acyltransferase